MSYLEPERDRMMPSTFQTHCLTQNNCISQEMNDFSAFEFIGSRHQNVSTAVKLKDR